MRNNSSIKMGSAAGRPRLLSFRQDSHWLCVPLHNVYFKLLLPASCSSSAVFIFCCMYTCKHSGQTQTLFFGTCCCLGYLFLAVRTTFLLFELFCDLPVSLHHFISYCQITFSNGQILFSKQVCGKMNSSKEMGG